MTHPLHSAPACHPEDLGRPIPDSLHAVSVCLPTWDDVIGYEEQDPRVISRLRTGYPRFFFHPLIEKVRAKLRTQHARAHEDVLPFADAAAAEQCATHISPGARFCDAGGGLWGALFPASELPRARDYWQHSGRILSSRAAEDWLENGALLLPDNSLILQMRCRLADWSGAPPGLTSLHASGMAAIFTAFEAVTARRPGRRTVMFGFPYIDTLKILQKFGPGVEFFPRGNAADLDTLGRLLQSEEIAGVFCEFPGNPLLRSPDLVTLRRLTSENGAAMVVDDTIGTFHNVDVLPFADLLTTSLTKAISGEGDVMAGSLITNPRGIFAERPPAPAAGTLYARDLEVLERNSRDFPSRMAVANSNAAALAVYLQEHPAVAEVHYPGVAPDPFYEARRKPEGGYGAVVSFLPKSATVNTPLIFSQLAVNRGISLGTTYTLACPYVQLAHYRELDWAAACGIDPHLLRVSVGTEERRDLLARFGTALQETGH